MRAVVPSILRTADTRPNGEAEDESSDGEDGDSDNDGHRPLSDILIRDLTAHRTLGFASP